MIYIIYNLIVVIFVLLVFIIYLKIIFKRLLFIWTKIVFLNWLELLMCDSEGTNVPCKDGKDVFLT